MVPSLRPRPLVWLLLLLLLLAGACGGGGGSTSPTPPPDDDCVIGDGPEVTVQGLVAYERLVLSPAGLGPGIETRPARFVDVRIRLEGGGTCYGQTSTDAAGAYSLVVRPPEGSRLEVWVYSRTNLDVLRRIAVHDALPPSGEVHAETDNFRYASAAFASTTAGPVDVVVPYGAGTYDRPSIGFGLLDTLVTCTESVRTTTGRFLPVCHAYTQLGNNGATGTSYYVVEARALTFLGGAAGQLDTTDTDYFDDAVVAHEFGHFLEFNLAHTLTRAGPHAGQELEPNFSWSEGQATGFGCLCRGTPSYIDTWGTNGNGTLIQASAENWPQTVRGIGGEETVAELVWDLGDGLDGIPDTDGDVARVGRGSLFDAFFTFSPETDAPYVGLFLDRLVDAGDIPAVDVDTLLQTPENQQIRYPLTGDDVWPIPLGVPGSDTDLVDATVGNRCRGYDASRWYRIELAATRTVTFDLQISPTPPTGDNLDLYVLACSGVELGSSRHGGSTAEQVVLTLAPGCYLVRVEANCIGSGNRATYTLTVSE